MLEIGFNIQIFSASICVMKLYYVRLLPESIEKYYLLLLLLLLLLFTSIDFSLGGSSPYTSNK